MSFKLTADLSYEEVKKAITEYVERNSGMSVVNVVFDEDYSGSRKPIAKVELEKNSGALDYFSR